MAKEEWSVEVEAQTPGPVDEATADEILAALAGRGPALQLGDPMTIRFNLLAADRQAAETRALSLVRLALPGLTPIRARAETLAEVDARLEQL